MVVSGGVDAKLNALRKAVSDASDHASDSRSFYFAEYAATDSVKTILADTRNEDASYIVLDDFNQSTGVDAIDDVSGFLERNAEDIEEDDAFKTMEALAKAVSALGPYVTKFKTVESFSQSVREDGATKSTTLILTKSDGKKAVVGFAHNPF
jgi:hypothetical protein